MKSTQMVHFLHEPVTGVSRHPISEEYDAMLLLEGHFSNCRICYGRVDEWRVRDLCSTGRSIAREIGELMHGGGDGKVYMSSSLRAHFTRIEIPNWFANTARSLGLTYRRPTRPTRSYTSIRKFGETPVASRRAPKTSRLMTYAFRSKIRGVTYFMNVA